LEETDSGDELDKLAKTLNEMLSRLDESFRQIRQFSADASHELQTPLTILRGELELALRAPRDPAEYQRAIESALDEIDRMATLVEGLLYLARTDAGVAKMDKESIALEELIEEVCSRLSALAKDRAVQLTAEELQPITLQGDRTRLRQLLTNIVQNGIKYTPAGGSVTIRLRTEADQAMIEVSDTGIGFSQDDEERVFQRFYRAGDARSTDGGGAGLGLSIAQAIAEGHGGEITVTSIPDQGSVFTIALPLEYPSEVTET
jgi:heavy metal sensor kinase